MAKKLSASSPRVKRPKAKGKDTRNLTAEMRTDLDFLEAQPEESIRADDPDAPDRSGEPGWVRGEFYRPKKKPISIRIDMDILDWFKKRSEPYQASINKALRAYMDAHARRSHSNKG